MIACPLQGVTSLSYTESSFGIFLFIGERQIMIVDHTFGWTMRAVYIVTADFSCHTQTFYSTRVRLSFRPSVCPSVRHAPVLCQNEES